MKKLLLLSFAFLAVMSAKAQDIIYNFYDSWEYIQVLDEEWGDNYDLIDKTGSTINMEGVSLIAKDDNGDWQPVEEYLPYGIPLSTGEMTLRSEMDAAGEAYIGWETGYRGPSRVTWMYNWDNREAARAAGDYGPETEADYVPSRGAINFLRNSNSGAREGTYLQLPPVTGPHTINVWVGLQGGSNDYQSTLRAIATPVVDGTLGEPITLVDTTDFIAKSFRKVSTSYDGNGSVAWRIGCDGYELYIVYVTIEKGATGINEITATSEADAAIYNLQGMKVDSSYKGIVIKNGKKYIQN